MDSLLTPEMTALTHALGELVKADPRNDAIRHAIEDYERDEELNALIAEYNAQQTLLSDAVRSGEDLGEDFGKTVRERIDALYDEITANPVYAEYIRAKQAFDALTNGIMNELQYASTGERPCNHDCSNCAGCH